MWFLWGVFRNVFASTFHVDVGVWEERPSFTENSKEIQRKGQGLELDLAE